MRERTCQSCKLNEGCVRVWKNREPVNCVSYYPIKTNADRIREMSDEKLAAFIWEKTNIERCPDIQCEDDNCRGCWLRWLKQGAEHE